MEADNLSEPLLLQQQDTAAAAMPSSSSSSNWSQEVADVATLYVPLDWNVPYPTCALRYDAERDLLLIVSKDCEEEETVLDVIQTNDIIGADLDLQFLAENELSDPATRKVGFRNEKYKKKFHPQQQDGDDALQTPPPKCDIFGALRENKNIMERIFTWAGGCAASEIPFDSQATAYLNIYCYPRRRPSEEGWLSWCGVVSHEQKRNPKPPVPISQDKLGHRYAHHRRFEVVPRQDFSHIGALVRNIRRVAKLQQFESTTKSRPTRYLVVVNPVSGKKQGTAMYESIIKPMLDQACVEHDLCTTRHHRHAEERMIRASGNDERDLVEYDGVIAAGGDGLLNEIVNGVKGREDADEIWKRLKFGVVAVGTSNGLAKSLLYECKENFGILESVFLICKGQTQKMDLSIYQIQQKTYTSFLTFTWAFIADVDIESECIRFCGMLRNDIWAAWRIVNLRTYRGRFSYLPSTKVADKTRELAEMPALTDPVPEDWVTIEDDFVLFWASQVSHAASNVLNSPKSKLQDGVFQVLVIRAPVSRLKLASMSLAFDTGGHVDYPAAEVYECVAYRLEPLSPGSFNDLDGEAIESGPVQAHVVPASFQLFCGTAASE